MKELLQRRAEARGFEMIADLRETRLHGVDEVLVGNGELTRLRDLPETSMRVDERAVREISPGRDELVVVAANKIGPREIGVLRLRAGEHEIEPERVRVIT